MKLRLKGLNVSLEKVDDFEIDPTNDFEISNLENFYFTFESVYYLSKYKIPYVLNMKNKSFQELDNEIFNDEIKLLNVCANTNFFWCLTTSKSSKNIELIQFTSNKMHKRIQIPITDLDFNLNDLILIATDINVYVFENSEYGLKCLFELVKKTELDKKRVEQEVSLNEDSISSITLNKIIIREKIQQFTAGKEHIIMLTSYTNQLFSFGIGTKGQLGTSKIENLFEPTCVECLKNSKIIKIPSSSGWHSGCIDSNGNCYLWGWNSHGQVGIINNSVNDSVFIVEPTMLNIQNDFGIPIKFKHISFGSSHTVLIDTDNNLYSFGWNKYSQLFYDDLEFYVYSKASLNITENESSHIEELDWPQTIQLDEPTKFTNFKIIDAKCGCWSTLILYD